MEASGSSPGGVLQGLESAMLMDYFGIGFPLNHFYFSWDSNEVGYFMLECKILRLEGQR